MKMKMDLRLVVTNSSELQDHGYGEVAKECSTSKYFKDKRKTKSFIEFDYPIKRNQS